MADPPAALEAVKIQSDKNHAELIDRVDKLEKLLVKLDSKPNLVPKFIGAPTFPAVLAGFTDYIGLAMITPALPYYIEAYYVSLMRPNAADIAYNYTAIFNTFDTANQLIIKGEITRWTGRITAAQFFAIFVSNVFWALFGDRIPSMTALQLTVLGDAGCFAGSAFLKLPFHLLLVRAATGLFSPLVPAIVYLLDRARSMEQVLEGVANFTLSVVVAYAVASAIVGFAYSYVGWEGVNLIAAGANALALFVVTCFSAPPTKPGPKPAPEGASDALFTKWFVLHATTAFVQGWMMASMVMMYVLLMKHHFGLAPNQTALVLIVLPAILFVQNRLAKMATLKYGLNAVVTCGCGVALLNECIFAIPAVHYCFPAFCVCMVLQQACVLTQMAPNQARAQKIAAFYAPKATSAVTGWGRVFFALGQGIGPLITGDLFAIVPWAGFAVAIAVQLLEVGAILLCSSHIPLFKDQDPPKLSVAPPVGNDAAQRQATEEIECNAIGGSNGVGGSQPSARLLAGQGSVMSEKA